MIVTIQKSTIPQAGKGVFANRDIKKYECLAEYKGEFLTLEDYDKKDKKCKNPIEMDYIWQLEDEDGEIISYIDGWDKSKSNWTRYVNCPCKKRQENVIPIQKNLKMYYYANRNIKKGEELFIWYGAEYGEKLGCKE